MLPNLPISVLIAVYIKEQPAYFDLALRSIFEQTRLAAQIVIVQDGPITPSLEAIIRRWAVIHPDILTCVPLTQNVGLGAALNAGLKHCTYEIIARMDSDDISLPERFEKQYTYLKQHPEIAIVGSWINEFDQDPSQITGTRRLPTTNHEIRRFAKLKCPLNHPSVMFHKSAINVVGGYQPFYLFEDYFLWIRLLNHNYQFANIPESLVLMRTGRGLFARRGGWKYAKSEIKLQKKFLSIGFINYAEFSRNILVRLTVRLLPNKLRTYIYINLLRKTPIRDTNHK